MNKIISTDILVSYSQCPRKAYLLLCTKQKGKPHEYVCILQRQKIANQRQYINALKQKHSDVQSYAEKGLKNKCGFLVGAMLQVDGLEADCGLLVKVKSSSALGRYSYEPTIFTGTHTVTKEQRLQLMFTGYVLTQIQKKQPTIGKIIRIGSRSTKVKLEDSGKTLIPFLEPLQEWVDDDSPEAPPVILNKHCSLCQFRLACQAKAEQEDNLSLLSRVTPKVIRRYEKKGIFTVKQLSYLYKPRKRKKRTKNPPKPIHKIELQALAIRTEKIYLQELPKLTRQPIELFLDLEGVPDRGLYYLIGFLVCEGETTTYHSFWADSDQDEEQMWRQFLEKAQQYPAAPIYHYGSYEPRAIAKLARRYETDSESLTKRLVNVNSHIYGKVYFPVRSNGLKVIGEFIGATWTSPDASGLQSLVWRHHWDEIQNAKYQELLVIYNEEDCWALKLLTDELSRIKHSADTLSEVDFADQPKRQLSNTGQEVHSQFKEMLKFAHTNYDKAKIKFHTDENKPRSEKVERRNSHTKKRKRPKARKTIVVVQRGICPIHENEPLVITKRTSQRVIIDLILTNNSIRKRTTKYLGIKEYCPKCKRDYVPPDILKYGKAQRYGHGFKAWIVYHRVALRLSYGNLVETVKEHFNREIRVSILPHFFKDFAMYYTNTSEHIAQRMLESPFIHADETLINIKGFNQYVWIFTDGMYVVFKLTETREASIVNDVLGNYEGIIISDFYPGYDSMQYKQQKCWVHLIRDINNDLWANPFDTEFEQFVLDVKNLIIPIMVAIQKYGLKKRNLNKFEKQVDKFYRRTIIDRRYKSGITQKYQARFIRYRNSLFTFIEENGIPWHNNTAENAIRHFAIQRDASTHYCEAVARDYLLLLGIQQTCRFQGKSFFKFLFSGETDIDQFQRSKRSRRV